MQHQLNQAKTQKMITDCDTAKAEFIHTDPLLKNLFYKRRWLCDFPHNIGKGAVGVGGAREMVLFMKKAKL